MDSNVQSVRTILKYTYGLVPIVAGLDKFANFLTDWTQYLSDGMVEILPFEPSVFMMIIGVIEIVAGVLVLTKTNFGAYLVSGWLVLIALTLIVSGIYLDVAVRDVVMAIGAFSLAKLSENKFKART
ncbi:hypothetical protein [Gelidibacter sp.]|uniref:hypothetical protein n=1 Tax=Gelidibacter sp. TaxID=2018083 RepID=UPI002B548A61|nr:hypothetical protein [Gelidibacter sp.]HUH28115.1 hypothetical protein [Gelidibacter sp.]